MHEQAISVVIVNFNTKEFLAKCLNSILVSSFDKKRLKIVVVDNASTDRSVKDLQRQYPTQVKWVQLQENVGFSRANNIGVQECSRSSYIFFLNPDTVVERDTLKELLVYCEENPQVGIVTPYVELPTGKIDDACHRGFPTPWNALMHFSGMGSLFASSKIFNGYHLGYKYLDKIHEIDACAGAAMFTRRKCGEDIGWWDEDFFWYGEDLDFCYRAKQKGWKIIFYPFAKVVHFKGVAGGIKRESQHLSKADQKTRKQARQARFEAMKIFYKKHYQNKYPDWLNRLVFLGIKIVKFFLS